MKKHIMTKLGSMLCLVLGIVFVLPAQMRVQAVEAYATVQGSVMTGTTSSLLKLSTQEGMMEIKIDSGTDASGCKILLPGRSVGVSVNHGTDGYLHAVTITAGTQVQSITLDSSTNVTVTGTINNKSGDSILYVDTAQGEMQIKLDQATDMSGCSMLVVDRTYAITCARGSDAYLHAVSIADSLQGNVSGASSGASSPTGSSQSPSPETVVTAERSTVTGTVDSKTREDLMYLSTAYGEMQIVIDNNTDSRNGMFIMPGRTMIVSVYHGSDAYMHAAVIMGSKETVQPASVDTSAASTVTGTVNARSNENMLYLQTQYGEMELKLDTVRSMTGYKVLTADRKVTVTCARGSDAYMHVLDIVGN